MKHMQVHLLNAYHITYDYHCFTSFSR